MTDIPEIVIPVIPVEPGVNMAIMDVDLNDYNATHVAPLVPRIVALEEAGKAKNGREIEIKVGAWPVSVEETPETRAIIWRHEPREGEPDDPWKLLVMETELKGDAGEPGAEGPVGKGLTIHGSFPHQEWLTERSQYENHGYTFPEVGCVMIIEGAANEGWVYKGPVDHRPAVGHQGWEYITNWVNVGKVAGVPGPRGPRGPKGSSGSSIGMAIVSIMISSAISIATSSIMFDVEMMINDAVNDAMMAAEGAMEDIAQSAIEKAIDEAGEQFKGEKGDKGDEGKAGKDGRSCQIVGSYDYLTQFIMEYPLTRENVGKAALIHNSEGPRELWAITESHVGVVQVENFGDIRGPQGEASEWTVSFRDEHFVPKGQYVTVVSDLPSGVAGMYIQDSSSITVHGTKGSPESGEQVGFQMKVKTPVPPLVGDTGGFTTKDKFLTNNGEHCEWVDIGFDDLPRDYILLNSRSKNKVFRVYVDDEGRLEVVEEPKHD